MEILLLRLDFWDWLAFGTVLLLLEIFGAGGYLLRVGLTAACVGALGALLPGLALAGRAVRPALRAGRRLASTPSPQGR